MRNANLYFVCLFFCTEFFIFFYSLQNIFFLDHCVFENFKQKRLGKKKKENFKISNESCFFECLFQSRGMESEREEFSLSLFFSMFDSEILSYEIKRKSLFEWYMWSSTVFFSLSLSLSLSHFPRNTVSTVLAPNSVPFDFPLVDTLERFNWLHSNNKSDPQEPRGEGKRKEKQNSTLKILSTYGFFLPVLVFIVCCLSFCYIFFGKKY